MYSVQDLHTLQPAYMGVVYCMAYALIDCCAGTVTCTLLTTAGVPETTYPVMIRSRTKKVWQWMPSAEEQQRLEPLVNRMQRVQAAKQAAEQQAQGAAEASSS
jgi:hypothetical protein